MSSIIRLVSFLFHFSRHVRLSRNRFIAVIFLGLLVGLSNAGLIALINTRLRGDAGDQRWVLWGFVALCVAMPVSRYLSNLIVLRLTQQTLLAVRMQLCRSILQTPLRQLETMGHRVYTRP